MATRRTFAEIVQSAGVNFKLEYLTLWGLFNWSFNDEQGLNVHCYDNPFSRRDSETFVGLINARFTSLPCQIRKTYRTLAAFDCANHFSFDKEEYKNVDDDGLLTYLEYTLSLISSARMVGVLRDYGFAVNPYISHCNLLAERLGHKIIFKDAFAYLVPASMPVIEVARLLPEELSYKTYMYNHRSVTGDIEKKKETLYALAQQLEPRRSELPSELAKVIFGLVNTANVRHNNVDPGDPSKYQPKIAALSKDEFENLYDDIYEMMLLAFMHLDAKPVIAQRTPFLQELKS